MVNIVEKVDDLVPVKNVLLSLWNKDGVDELVEGLIQHCPDVCLVASGGTHKKLAEVTAEIPGYKGRLMTADEYTGQKATQGGLVKTLDWKIHLGILTEKYNPNHQQDLADTSSIPFDMVVVNFYPFQAVLKETESLTPEIARAHIDIGGPTMIRGAAKNYIRVAAVSSPADYQLVLQKLREGNGSLGLKTRYTLAARAYQRLAANTQAIADFMKVTPPEKVTKCYEFQDQGGSN